MGALDGLQNDVFGHLAGAGFHHYDAGARAGDHEVEGAALDFLIRGVDGELAVDEPHARGGYGALEGYFRDGEGGGRADNRHHVVGVGGVRRQRGGDYLDFVAEVFGEEGSDGPVGEARDEDGVGGGPSLALEEAAGDLAARVEALFDVHREGEEVDALARRGGCRRDEQDVVVVLDEYRPAGFHRQLAGLERERAVADRYFEGGSCHVGRKASYAMGNPQEEEGRARAVRGRDEGGFSPEGRAGI